MSLSRLVALSLLLGAIGCGGRSPHPVTSRTARPAAPPPTAITPTPRELVPPGSGALSVMAPLRGLTLRTRPHGRVLAHLPAVTEWESPTVVWAVKRRGDWLGVVTTALKNNHVGWVDVRRTRPRMWRTRYSLHADLSKRTLVLLHDGRVIRRMSVGIGGPSTPTPTGRFTLTDKLIPAPSQSYYGCCLLALSGHQAHLRPNWAGGDRIAIHGGGGVGAAASAGCLHASDRDLKRLMKILPVGTPVVIRA